MVEFKIMSKISKPEPYEILNRLSIDEEAGVAFKKIIEFRENGIKPTEGDSQSVALMLFLEIRKNMSSKDWLWIRGINKKNKENPIFHSWLQYKGWAIDPLPGFRIKSQTIVPGQILIMDKSEYKENTGFTIMSKKREKQVLRWIEKNNQKHQPKE